MKAEQFISQDEQNILVRKDIKNISITISSFIQLKNVLLRFIFINSVIVISFAHLLPKVENYFLGKEFAYISQFLLLFYYLTFFISFQFFSNRISHNISFILFLKPSEIKTLFYCIKELPLLTKEAKDFVKMIESEPNHFIFSFRLFLFCKKYQVII